MNYAELAGVQIPLLSHLNSSQTYKHAARSTLLEMGDGSLVNQVYAGTQRKLITSLSAQGPFPPGLDAIDFTQPLLLKCAAERDLITTSTNVAVPTNRRSDTGYEPWARAFIGEGSVLTPMAMAGDTASITPVAGATRYQVLWYPELMVYVPDGLNKQTDIDGAMVGWDFTAREI